MRYLLGPYQTLISPLAERDDETAGSLSLSLSLASLLKAEKKRQGAKRLNKTLKRGRALQPRTLC